MVTFVVDLCSFSPNGLTFACVIQSDKKILVRNSDAHEHKFKVDFKFAFTESTDGLKWSGDSSFIGTISRKCAVVNIYSIALENWKCKISFGSLNTLSGIGLWDFFWTKDARHVICISGENTFLSVWSIKNKCVEYIKDIAKVDRYDQSFSPDGSLLAIPQITDTFTPIISIYSCKTWTQNHSFPVNCKDLAGLSWSPSLTQDVVVLWDSNLFSNVYIYNVQTGHLIKQYSPYGISSGFNTVQWADNGCLVCTSHRNEIHVLNGLTFGLLIHDCLEPSYVTPHYVIYYEPSKQVGIIKYDKLSKWPTNDPKINIHLPTYPRFSSSSHSLDMVGVKLASGGTMACVSHIYPHIVWIYNILHGCLQAVLIHQHPVLDFGWNPISGKLAIICVHSGLLYFWKNDNSTYICVQGDIPSLSSGTLDWSPQGDLLTVRYNDKISLFTLQSHNVSSIK